MNKRTKIDFATELKHNEKLRLYTALSTIPLDIEGSNLENTGWMPQEDDLKLMGQEHYDLAIEEHNLKNSKVMFKNVSLGWDSCDCGDGYGCSHGSYVYEIRISSHDKTHTIDMEEDYICFENNGKYGCLPISTASIFDFIRMCELCEIELELSDYALALFR